MRGNAQLDGRPLLPPSECYCVVNASPLNYSRWVGQNSGPIFSHLWTKVNQIKFACSGVSVVCNAVFRLTMFVAFRRYSRSSREVVRNRAKISCFWAAKFWKEEAPKFLTEFHKSGLPSNMWKRLVTIGQATLEIRRRKKNKETRSKRQQ